MFIGADFQSTATPNLHLAVIARWRTIIVLVEFSASHRVGFLIGSLWFVVVRWVAPALSDEGHEANVKWLKSKRVGRSSERVLPVLQDKPKSDY